MGIHMILILEVAVLGPKWFENKLYSRSGAGTEDDSELLRVSVKKRGKWRWTSSIPLVV